MDDVRVGRLIRLLRRRRRLELTDVASMAGVSQQTVSRVERGLFEEAGLRALRAIAAVLRMSLPFEPRVASANADRVLDGRHLAVIQRLVPQLEAHGWLLRLEYSFNYYGERGCIDILGWHPERLALLIVEVKSELDEVQVILRVMDVRDRVMRKIAAREFGAQPLYVASVLAIADESSNRRAVDRYATALDLAVPARTVAVKHWVCEPAGDLRGIWFVPVRQGREANRNAGSSGRIR